jgi:hypothetical protein
MGFDFFDPASLDQRAGKQHGAKGLPPSVRLASAGSPPRLRGFRRAPHSVETSGQPILAVAHDNNVANPSNGQCSAAQPSTAPAVEAEPPPETLSCVHPRNYTWAELMKRVFLVDVLECQRCGGRIKILAAIHPPEATRKILECLGLPSRSPAPGSCRCGVRSPCGFVLNLRKNAIGRLVPRPAPFSS